MTKPSPLLAFASAIVLCPWLAGCSTDGQTSVDAAAERFYRAVDEGDGAAACSLLAPKTRQELEQSAAKPCDEAILEQDIPSVGNRVTSERFGQNARVSFARDTTFLARFPDGWRVMAAACTFVPGAPYDCQLKGG